MATIIDCPTCSRQLRVPDKLLGKSVNCPSCGLAFTATARAPESPSPSAASSGAPPQLEPMVAAIGTQERLPSSNPAAREERAVRAEQDHPQPVRPSGDPRAHRGRLILVLGILALLTGPIMGWGLGPIAWLLGSGDLNEMKAGRMDPAGEGLTRTGLICGMVATCLALLGVGVGCCVGLLRV